MAVDVKKIKNVKMLVIDVDGIMTNGDINVDHNGNEFKVYNVQDGFAIVQFQRLGFKTAIITARSTPSVTARAEDLKIQYVYQNAYPKIKAYEQLLQECRLGDNDVCYMGDDLPDLALLKRVGFSVTVPNAVKEVKNVADYITKNPGGQGAIRETIELILRTQGKWKKFIEQFS